MEEGEEQEEEEEEQTSTRRSLRRSQESKPGELDDDLPLHNTQLQELLQDVMKHKDSWPFTRAVIKSEVSNSSNLIIAGI